LVFNRRGVRGLQTVALPALALPLVTTPLRRPKRLLPLDRKVACVTLDYETDYGDRVGAFNILHHHRREIDRLAERFAELGVPISAFIRTDLLLGEPGALEAVRSFATDFHCHSHTHATRDFDSEREIAATAETFVRCFGSPPRGYRAPLGVLNEGDLDLLEQHGFEFSSSVFPSYRPGKFNHLSMPTVPFLYENDLLELPLAVVPRIRYTISLSYLKLIGLTANRLVFSAFGLPDLLIFDSHLHDFIVCEESLRQLPPSVRIPWSINKGAGVRYFETFVKYLRRRGYEFLSLTELVALVRTTHGLEPSARPL
jgi:peptidoglycan/xylan/chitin deacetylase (PgdA/CDA1 family)